MRALQLNTFDQSGGAAKAASRLTTGLRQLGVDATMLVQAKSGDAPWVADASTPAGRMLRPLRPHLDALPVRLYPDRQGMFFFPALLPDTLARQTKAFAPDLIHLHWLAGGFARVETLRRLGGPLVWTLHDSWPFTGGCQIPFDCTRYRESCGKCPVLGSSHERDLSRWVWRRKRKAWEGLELTVVAPSRWLAECARASSLFRDLRVEMIPNGVDVRRYRPFDSSVARELLGLPRGKRLILFGAKFSTTDRNKGFHLLVEALRKVAAAGWGGSAEIVVFGSSQPTSPPDLGMPTRYLGWLHDDVTLSLLYAAADVFVFPSIQEVLGYTVMEAMACGTPSVAFDQGGVVDLIEHEHNGYLARPYLPEDLARGIAWVLEDGGRREELSLRSRQKVEREFALEKVARQHVELYDDLIRGHSRARSTQ